MKKKAQLFNIGSFYNTMITYCLKEFIEDSFKNYDFIQRENYLFAKKIFDKNMRKPMELASLFSENFDYHNYEMSSAELKDYNMAQLKEIHKLREHLEESEQRTYGIEEVIQLWAQNYSSSFRKFWHLKRVAEFV